jgi:type I restriction enzyme S subunit
MRTGPFGSLLGRSDYVADGVPIVGVESIGRMEFIRVSKQFVSPSKAEALSEYSIEPGDVLVSRSGTVGEVCVVPNDAGPGIISTNTIRICIDSELVSPALFGFSLIGSSPVLTQIHDLCSGSTRDFLNQGILSALRVPLPPRPEQHELTARLAAALGRCDELERALGTSGDRISTLDRSLLAKAFRGELVPQDPTDEPAADMLARLRAAEAATPPKPTKSRR